jgi:hypothetical protein
MIGIKLTGASLVGALTLTLLGCSDGRSADALDEPVESVAQGWASGPCSTALEDTTLVGDEGVVQSPRTYNTCGKSFVVNVQKSNATKTTIVWNDGLPTSASSCRDTELGAMVFTLNSAGAWEWRDQKTLVGTWVNATNLCLPLAIGFDLAALGGNDFRIAATARRISGGNPTRKLAVALAK